MQIHYPFIGNKLLLTVLALLIVFFQQYPRLMMHLKTENFAVFESSRFVSTKHGVCRACDAVPTESIQYRH